MLTHVVVGRQARLEEHLAAAKKELKSALDRVEIAEEIYKANLETITQLECAPAVPKASMITQQAEDTSEVTSAPPAATPSTQPEGPPSSELERVQRPCAAFQEQCLWRSVENMELEAQLAASQVEATSWREAQRASRAARGAAAAETHAAHAQEDARAGGQAAAAVLAGESGGASAGSAGGPHGAAQSAGQAGLARAIGQRRCGKRRDRRLCARRSLGGGTVRSALLYVVG